MFSCNMYLIISLKFSKLATNYVILQIYHIIQIDEPGDFRSDEAKIVGMKYMIIVIRPA